VKISKFKLGNGDVVDLIKSQNSTYLKDPDTGCTITSNNHFGYVERCYEYLLKKYNILNSKLCIIHMGVGFGYDLLYVDSVFKKLTEDYRMIGVDLIDYGDLRVSLDKFSCPIKFYSQDVMKYLQHSRQKDFRDDLNFNCCVVLFVDLFLKGNTPISLIYDKKFWIRIRDSINPHHIVINLCGGSKTHPIVSDNLEIKNYTKKGCLEFYELSR
tara:strand:- start:277 stop:915 length:639 start_codon:yes stop_codon:yes gene_type:complete